MSKPDPAALRACYLSGQMSEAQWQEHIANGDVEPVAGTVAPEDHDDIRWKPIDTAPKNGERLIGIHAPTGVAHITWYGKTSHIPLYGWCWNDGDPEDTDLWHPTHWMRQLPFQEW